jgi:hypothetical protein
MTSWRSQSRQMMPPHTRTWPSSWHSVINSKKPRSTRDVPSLWIQTVRSISARWLIRSRRWARLPEAEASYRSALAIDVNDYLVNLRYGQFLESRGRLTKATIYLERALASDPGNSRALALLERIRTVLQARRDGRVHSEPSHPLCSCPAVRFQENVPGRCSVHPCALRRMASPPVRRDHL